MSNNQGMFETATRIKLRFGSPRGDLSVESLWDVPLRSRDDFNLDTVARGVNNQLKAMSEESFVSTHKSPEQGKLELALDIVKFVIETKLGEEAAAKRRADNRKERERLTEILAEKQDEKLMSMSEAQLKKRIASLGED